MMVVVLYAGVGYLNFTAFEMGAAVIVFVWSLFAHPHGLGRRGGPARGRRRGRGRGSPAGGSCRDGRPRGRASPASPPEGVGR
ncbi:hypothetical protein [Brachybacterium sp. GPGPB12]|uniref:hypothetical protein n=1 Tax=Brachybacterium sp. GPGPB12 TaxID=3023517 RepID=UPI0031346011